MILFKTLNSLITCKNGFLLYFTIKRCIKYHQKAGKYWENIASSDVCCYVVLLLLCVCVWGSGPTAISLDSPPGAPRVLFYHSAASLFRALNYRWALKWKRETQTAVQIRRENRDRAWLLTGVTRMLMPEIKCPTLFTPSVWFFPAFLFCFLSLYLTSFKKQNYVSNSSFSDVEIE